MIRSLLSKLLLILIGCLFSLGLATALLMLFPRQILGPTTYYERNYAGQTMQVDFRPSHGDLFVALPGSIRPPETDEIIETFTLGWDADGFRLPAEPADAYPIALFGDSFTEGFNVPYPYADRLAEQLDMPVKNYGYRAYGPVEVAQAAAEYAGDEPREWLIYGYFSGNDLGDTMHQNKIDTSSPVAVWQALFERLNPPIINPYDQPPADHYDFPMPVIIQSSYYDLAFLWYYWWWELVPPDDAFLKTRNFEILGDSLDTLTASVQPETCKALVFIPTKEMLYYRYIYESERRWVRDNGQRLEIDANNEIRIVPAPIAEADEDAFIDAMYGQRNAVQKLLAQHPGWLFIDLTPAFEAKVAEGALLYYPYDSHWNQAGHDLAAETIAAAIRDSDCGQD